MEREEGQVGREGSGYQSYKVGPLRRATWRGVTQMASSIDLARQFGVNQQTIRNWANRFADYLSADATPPGEKAARVFTDADEAVILTVYRLRQHSKTYDEIEALLADGYRESVLDDVPGDETGGPLVTLTPEAMQREIVKRVEEVARWEGRYSALEGERDRLIEERDEAQKQATEAEKRAAYLEGQLDGLKPPATEGQPRPWWKRLLGG